jgi:cytochrome c
MTHPRTVLGGLLTAAVLVAVPSCGSPSGIPESDTSRPDATVSDGDADRAPDIFRAVGCASCHTIPGVDEADADVGPPLDRWSRREYIAGRLTNTPEHLLRWLLDPKNVDPRTAMPDVGLTDQEARDLVAYLYGLE